LRRLSFYTRVISSIPELEAVVDAVSNTLQLCVHDPAPASDIEAVLDVEDLFLPKHVDLVTFDRKLLRQGLVNKRQTLHLFNDILLVSTIGSAPLLKLVTNISLANLVVRDTSCENSRSYSCVLEARGLVCARIKVPDQEEMDTWIKSIRNATMNHSLDHQRYRTQRAHSRPFRAFFRV
jgi:hypothetical protein